MAFHPGLSRGRVLRLPRRQCRPGRAARPFRQALLSSNGCGTVGRPCGRRTRAGWFPGGPSASARACERRPPVRHPRRRCLVQATDLEGSHKTGIVHFVDGHEVICYLGSSFVLDDDSLSHREGSRPSTGLTAGLRCRRTCRSPAGSDRARRPRGFLGAALACHAVIGNPASGDGEGQSA